MRTVNGWAIKRPGHHLAVVDRVPLIPVSASRPSTSQTRPRGPSRERSASLGLGQGRIVVRCDTEPLTGRSVVLVTPRVDGNAANSIGLSRHRWPTDTFYPDRTGHLGCNAYRLRRTPAMGTMRVWSSWPMCCGI